jgi:hypothetical protein
MLSLSNLCIIEIEWLRRKIPFLFDFPFILVLHVLLIKFFSTWARHIRRSRNLVIFRIFSTTYTWKCANWVITWWFTVIAWTRTWWNSPSSTFLLVLVWNKLHNMEHISCNLAWDGSDIFLNFVTKENSAWFFCCYLSVKVFLPLISSHLAILRIKRVDSLIN